jgi:putative radical SAM enzyme (TIGR03279 family)
MVRVELVEPGSYAEELGLLAGDRLLSINDHEIVDIVDYHRHAENGRLLLGVLREDNELWEFELEKDPHEDLGLTIEHPQPRQCGNQCLFCFVHQLPKGMRRSLYIKDEDYRFSYLYGSYITLTNLKEADLQRIIRDQLSPLYISVHATEHPLREELLGTKVPEILPLIDRLTSAGIKLHCQIVLCPGVNDGKALQRTIKDLGQFYPQVVSLAVVPVGLTKYRDKLPQLRKMSQQDAKSCLRVIHQYQNEFLHQHGSRFVFPADELYLLAEQRLPSFSEYEDFHQLENGVGMIVQFRQQAVEVLEEIESLGVDKATLITGCLFQSELREFAEELAAKAGIALEVIAINNNFFGADVSVAGLITGADLLAQLQGLSLGNGLLIPDVMLKDRTRFFLDDISIDDIESALQLPVIAVESSPWGILDGLELLSGGSVEIIHV